MLGGELSHDSYFGAGKYQFMRIMVSFLALGLVAALSYHTLMSTTSSNNSGASASAITSLKHEVDKLSATLIQLQKQPPPSVVDPTSSPSTPPPNITASWIPITPDDLVSKIVAGLGQSSVVQDIAKGVHDATTAANTAANNAANAANNHPVPPTPLNITALVQEIVKSVHVPATPAPTTPTTSTPTRPTPPPDPNNKIPVLSEEYQFGLETPWGPDDAYYRCDNFHLAGDGLNLHQYHIVDLLLESICLRRNFVLPNFRIRVKTDIWLHWTDLFKWRDFSNAVHARWGIWLVPPELVPPGLQVVTQDTCAPALTEKSPRRGSEATVFWRPTYDRNHDPISTPTIGTTDRDELFSMMMHHLHPSAHLEEEIDRLIEPIGKNFVCLHLRTEADWVGYFKQPNAGYITLDQTARRFEMTKKHFDQTHDPRYQELFMPNQTLYVAGEHPDEFEAIQRAFGPYYARVVTKEHLGTLRRNYSNTERALIEREICSRSHVFILNKFSQWSEWVYYSHSYRYYPETGKWDFGTKDERDKHNFRVNPNHDNESPDITFYTACLYPTGMPDMSGRFGLNC